MKIAVHCLYSFPTVLVFAHFQWNVLPENAQSLIVHTILTAKQIYSILCKYSYTNVYKNSQFLINITWLTQPLIFLQYIKLHKCDSNHFEEVSKIFSKTRVWCCHSQVCAYRDIKKSLFSSPSVRRNCHHENFINM